MAAGRCWSLSRHGNAACARVEPSPDPSSGAAPVSPRSLFPPRSGGEEGAERGGRPRHRSLPLAQRVLGEAGPAALASSIASAASPHRVARLPSAWGKPPCRHISEHRHATEPRQQSRCPPEGISAAHGSGLDVGCIPKPWAAPPGRAG